MAAFLANVGVNAGHRVSSPLLPDRSFLRRLSGAREARLRRLCRCPS